jgi:uncharacterized membrane protein
MPPRRDTARWMAALALALSFAPSLMRRSKREQLAISVGSAALGAAAGAATETLVVQVARRVEGGEPVARLAIAGAGAASAVLQLESSNRIVALLGTAARVAGISALLGWVTPERRRVGGFDPLPLAAAGALAAGVMAVRSERRRRRRRKVDFPQDRYLATVSFGPDSLVPQASLDFEGQRFLAGATTDAPQDPIRVFVGVKSAANVGERVDLALAELDRLGAFRRRRIVICSATLRGYVNPIPVAAEERLAAGDVAHVTVQYHDKRTPYLWRKVPVAAQTHRLLVGRLGVRLRALGDDAPELVVYGESLGAWASQKVFQEEGLAGLERRGVQRALWVGTPHLSKMGRALKDVADPRVIYLRTRDIREHDPAEADRIRYVFLERLSDPVVLFPGVDLLWRRHGRGWRPGISFLQGLVDLVKATRWTADEPASAGHDYRIELPLTVNVAFGHRRPRDEVARIGQEVLSDEAERLRRVREARRSAPATEPPAR